jgi:hypothetical protein
MFIGFYLHVSPTSVFGVLLLLADEWVTDSQVAVEFAINCDDMLRRYSTYATYLLIFHCADCVTSLPSHSILHAFSTRKSKYEAAGYDNGKV